MNHASTAGPLFPEVQAVQCSTRASSGGGYGLGIIYAMEMFGAQEGR